MSRYTGDTALPRPHFEMTSGLFSLFQPLKNCYNDCFEVVFQTKMILECILYIGTFVNYSVRQRTLNVENLSVIAYDSVH